MVGVGEALGEGVGEGPPPPELPALEQPAIRRNVTVHNANETRADRRSPADPHSANAASSAIMQAPTKAANPAGNVGILSGMRHALARAVVVIVNCALAVPPLGLMDDGVKPQVAPVGAPLQDKVTA